MSEGGPRTKIATESGQNLTLFNNLITTLSFPQLVKINL